MKNIVLVVVSLLIGFPIGWFLHKAPDGFPVYEPVKIINPKPVSEIKPEIKWKDTTIYKDTGTYRLAIIHDTIPVLVPIDTEAILNDYLLERNYIVDTISGPVHAIVKMDVFTNKLIRFDAQFDYYQQKPRLKLKYGVMVGANQITPLFELERGKIGVTAGYGFGQSPGIIAGILYQF